MSETTSGKAYLWVIAIFLIVATLALFAPNYTSVRVKGPDGEIEVHRFGTGPQEIKVNKDDVRIRSSAW